MWANGRGIPISLHAQLYYFDLIVSYDKYLFRVVKLYGLILYVEKKVGLGGKARVNSGKFGPFV